LRKLLMDEAGTDKIEFDSLCEKVLAKMPESSAMLTDEPGRSPDRGV
jgi:hypothetical protein